MSIKAVIEAARQRYPERSVWAVWQPHTYSRTQALFDQFVTAFDEADHVLITDIYAARENPIGGVNSAAVVAAMQHADVRHTPTFTDAVLRLQQGVQSPAVVIIMSAGDAPDIGVQYLKLLQDQL
jgi:UDP-N-acetylmuramate--alanine ligase